MEHQSKNLNIKLFRLLDNYLKILISNCGMKVEELSNKGFLISITEMVFADE
jgi:hypothetical protein